MHFGPRRVSPYRTEIGLFGYMFAHGFVFVRQRHAMNQGIPCQLASMTLSMNVVHQNGKYEESRGLTVLRFGFQIGFRIGGVEEQVQQVHVLHESFAELIQQQDQMDLGVPGDGHGGQRTRR